MIATRGWLTVLVVAWGCSEHAASGTAGTGSAGAAACPSDYHLWTLPGVRADKRRDCVDVSADQMRFIDVCQPNDETYYYPSAFFYCFREIATGEEYWINPVFWLVEPVATEWEFCEPPVDFETNPDTLPPPPCFAQCSNTAVGHEEPVSTCAEGATRIVFACGGDSAWDENCCRRTPCSGVPCPDGFECRQVSISTPASFCWVGIGPNVDPETVDLDDPIAACSCVGANAAPEKWCFPL